MIKLIILISIIIVVIVTIIYFMMVPNSLDNKLNSYMNKYDTKAIQAYITQDNKMVHNINLGYANYMTKSQLDEKNVFRIASVSKTITAVGILTLVDKGMLSLDDKAIKILTNKNIINPSKIIDKRILDITIRDLLSHAGGWDTNMGIPDYEKPFDPQYDAIRAAKKQQTLTKPTPVEIIEFMIQFPLNFAPGTKSVYSNLGYNILGRIIEVIMNESYETAIVKTVFDKVGITGAYLANELPNAQQPHEVIYYDGPDPSYDYAADVSYPKKTTTSYGAFIMSVMDAHGGWVMNAKDMNKFGYGLMNNVFFSKKTFEEMIKRPSYLPMNVDKYYALGVEVELYNDYKIIHHKGALGYGTYAWLAIVPEKKIVLSFIENHMDKDIYKFDADMRAIFDPIFKKM